MTSARQPRSPNQAAGSPDLVCLSALKASHPCGRSAVQHPVAGMTSDVAPKFYPVLSSFPAVVELLPVFRSPRAGVSGVGLRAERPPMSLS